MARLVSAATRCIPLTTYSRQCCALAHMHQTGGGGGGSVTTLRSYISIFRLLLCRITRVIGIAHPVGGIFRANFLRTQGGAGAHTTTKRGGFGENSGRDDSMPGIYRRIDRSAAVWLGCTSLPSPLLRQSMHGHSLVQGGVIYCYHTFGTVLLLKSLPVGPSR